jgi:tRNA (guanine10-N2)-methyltransferase
MIRSAPIFDAIVCDPPYGIRARTHKVGIPEKKQERYAAHGGNIKPVEDYDEQTNFHASMKEQYSQKDIYSDLLNHANKFLRKGGHVVFLFHNDDTLSDEENKFPEHPGLVLTNASKDQLTKHRSRFLITMRKI